MCIKQGNRCHISLNENAMFYIENKILHADDKIDNRFITSGFIRYKMAIF